MKKAVSLLLGALMLTGLLAACGGSGGSAAETPAPDGGTPASEAAETSGGEAAATGDEITLNFLVMSDIETIQPVFDMYEEQNPGVKINLEVLSHDKMLEAIEVRLSAGDSDIDLFLADAPLVANYTAKDYLADLTPYVGTDSKARMTDTSIEYCTVNGELRALPLNSSSVMMYVNLDIFEANNVEPPVNDAAERWTWEHVVEVARQMTYEEDGKQIYGLSFDQINRPYQLLPLAQSLGAGPMVSEDGLTTTGYTNSPEMVGACQWYYDTFNTWNISPKISADDAIGYFTSGQVAIFVTGPWQIPAMEGAGMNFAFAPHPYFEGGEAVTPTGSWCVGVSNYSANQQAAAKFVEFLCTDDAACQMNYDLGRNLPCNISVLEAIDVDPAYDEFPANSVKLAAYEAMNTAQARPLLAGYAEWNSVIENAYSDIMNGADPQAALDGAVAEIDNQLKKYER